MTLRIGLVGAGFIGAHRAQVAQADPNAILVAVADVQVGRAQEVAERFGTEGCRVTGDWHTVTASTDVDVVIVATVHKYLAPVAEAALRAGKHVLAEKPLARNLAEGRDVVAAARESGRVVWTGFNHRYHPAIRQAHQLVGKGRIGEVLYARCVYGHGGRPGYEREWRADPDLSGGGELLDQGAHALDLFHWFIGPFAEVFAWTPTYVWQPKRVRCPVEDNAFVLMRTERGQVAELHASWTRWKNRFEFEVVGREGYLRVEGLGRSYGTERLALGRRRQAGGPPEEETWEYPGEDVSWAEEWAAFTHVVQQGSGRDVDEDALATLRLVDALYRSAAENRPVKL